MPSVLAMASLKGGAGKTTVGLNLAVTAQASGIRTVVIDLDPQQASAKWGDLRRLTHNGPAVISSMAVRLSQAMEDAKSLGAELVVIDTAAHAEGILAWAIDTADLVLIPCRPSVVDLQHLAATVQLATARNKPAAVLLNGVLPRTADCVQARGALCDMGMNVVPVSVSNLVAYGRAITIGQGVAEYEPDGKASAEMRALLAEITE
ncbi:MAG TPA: AAA family ATPase [Stellaceae bacterium]|nr:AAA family ATPase [Stellaceae bacterium]